MHFYYICSKKLALVVILLLFLQAISSSDLKKGIGMFDILMLNKYCCNEII
jgi:hypothetical protein